ncbi:TldD/PmbA family protein [Actinoplanes sp. NPDC051411]|uniref:TldD/PmbA family protein n=1 Tax=Actinoplanes sp. NPDC051411 TaxID=3155522 RepID=UPI00344A5A69
MSRDHLVFAEQAWYDSLTYVDGAPAGVETRTVAGAARRRSDAGGPTVTSASASLLPPGTVPAGTEPSLADLRRHWDRIAVVLDDAARGRGGGVRSVRLVVRRQTRLVRIGGQLCWHDTQRRIRATVIVDPGPGGAGAYTSIAARGPDELDEAELVTGAESAAERARWHAGGRPAPDRPLPIVLTGAAAGVFIHEALGHALEADNAAGAGAAGLRPGDRVTLAALTVLDDPAAAASWASQPRDDEGVPGERTMLVEDGVVRGCLHTTATAAAAGELPRGNGRCDEYGSVPLARMTTTYARPTGRSTAEMLAALPEAIICSGLSGGQADVASGRLGFTATQVAYARNGTPLHPLRPLQIGGRARDLLGRLEAVGDDLFCAPAVCVKRGQLARVTMGAPTLVLAPERAR